MNIQWYPGHMTKAKRAMKEDVKLVDLVIELVDARAPLASRNPDIDSLAAGKGRVILLNKADLASEKANAAWISYFEGQGFQVMKIDARAKATLKQLNALIQEACKEKIERDRRRGILNRPVRAMVVMIPTDNSEEIGVRPIVDREQADQVLAAIPGIEVDMTQNWNRRYRENLERLKSGNLLEVARVVKGLMLRELERGLSTGERKMLHSAKEILISEIVLSQSCTYEDVEARINTALN